MSFRSSLLIGSALCVAALPAAAVRAQSQPGDNVAQLMPHIVITATRAETELERIPAQVTVIDREAIDRGGYQTVEEALRTVPGLSVVRLGGPGQQTSVFMRGANSDHVLVLVDGVPVNDPSGAGGAYNFGDDLVGDLERIEVVRGPVSSLYGSNAIGGVINMITRAPSRKKAEIFGQAAGGSHGTAQAQAGLRGRSDGFDYMVSAEHFRTDGINLSPSRIAGNIGEKDGSEVTTVTGKLGYNIGDAGRVDALMRYRRNEFDLDNVPNEEPNYTGENEHFLYKLGGEAYLFDGSLTSRLDIGQSRHDRSFTNRPDAASANLTDDSYESVRSFAELQNTYRIGDLGGLRDTVLVFGGSAARSTVETSTNSVSVWGPFTQSLDADSNDYALYTNLQARVSERIDVTAGLRYDVPDDYDNTLTYRIGAVVAVPEILTRFSGAVGTAYKAPTLYDRFGVDNYGYRGNTNLSPEESFSWEVGFETDLPVRGRAKAVSFGATYFRTKTDDLITNDFVQQTVVNIGDASSEGVESFITLRPADWIETRLNYTWMQARNEDTGQMLLRRPRHQGSLSVDLKPMHDLSFGPELVYVGSRLDVAYDDAGSFLGNRRNGSYTLVNLSGSYQLREDVSLFGKVYNLFDREYEPSNGFAGRGLTALVGVRGSF